ISAVQSFTGKIFDVLRASAVESDSSPTRRPPAAAGMNGRNARSTTNAPPFNVVDSAAADATTPRDLTSSRHRRYEKNTNSAVKSAIAQSVLSRSNTSQKRRPLCGGLGGVHDLLLDHDVDSLRAVDRLGDAQVGGEAAKRVGILAREVCLLAQ